MQTDGASGPHIEQLVGPLPVSLSGSLLGLVRCPELVWQTNSRIMHHLIELFQLLSTLQLASNTLSLQAIKGVG
jgi:hypothetical protein